MRATSNIQQTASNFQRRLAWRIGCLMWIVGCWMFSLSAAEIPRDMVCVSNSVFTPLFRSLTDPTNVPVKSFLLDVEPVTNEQFLKFVRANPRWQRSQVKRIFAEENYLKYWAADLEPGTNARPRQPVVWVSWFAAKA